MAAPAAQADPWDEPIADPWAQAGQVLEGAAAAGAWGSTTSPMAAAAGDGAAAAGTWGPTTSSMATAAGAGVGGGDGPPAMATPLMAAQVAAAWHNGPSQSPGPSSVASQNSPGAVPAGAAAGGDWQGVAGGQPPGLHVPPGVPPGWLPGLPVHGGFPGVPPYGPPGPWAMPVPWQLPSWSWVSAPSGPGATATPTIASAAGGAPVTTAQAASVQVPQVPRPSSAPSTPVPLRRPLTELDVNMDTDSSSAGTSEIKSMLRKRAREGERPKSSIGSVKIEDFFGDRRRFRAWRRATEAQEVLYKLEPAELAMLLYLSTKGEARDILDQRPLQDYTAAGGLAIMWALLEEAFGESTAESFERAERELSSYRRLPGQSVSSYVAGMKRLRMNYLLEDPDSSWSDRAWAQRLLNRCSLSKRDRLDVFYSAGGVYNSESIERALRHRCAHLHEDERRVPAGARFRGATSTSRSGASTTSASSSSASTASTRRPLRKHGVHLAAIDEDEHGDDDEEDLEQEALGDQPGDRVHEDHTAGDADEDLDEDEGEVMDEDVGEAEVYEAFSAGWKAKAKVNARKLGRGYRRPTTISSTATSASGSARSLTEKKKASHCASCGQRGHWRGDPECPHVKSGQDQPHQPRRVAGVHEVNFTNFTFMVENFVTCHGCGKKNDPEANFCSKCGGKLSKRNWTVVTDTALGATATSSESEHPPPPRPMRDLRSVEVSKAALGKTSEPEKKVKLKPVEVLGAMDQLSKEEKKALKILLREEEEARAWETLHSAPLPTSSARGSGDFASLPRRQDPDHDRDQLPLHPRRGDLARPGGTEPPPLRPPSAKDEHGRDKAKAVKKRELDEFRQVIYRSQLEGGRCVPSTAAPKPTLSQARCTRPFEELVWSANDHGHYARCKRCDLKHILYYSHRHGVLMVGAGGATEEEVHPPPVSAWAPGLAVADTGCRTAVGGVHWHRALQEELRRLGITWETASEAEQFQFGSGPPVMSKQACLYPVGLGNGKVDVLRMSVVDGAAAQCPGLIGPSELSRWMVQFDFRSRELEVMGHRRPMKLTPTRHPALDLLDFGENLRPWDSPGMAEQKNLLLRASQSMAFIAGDSRNAELAEIENEESDPESHCQEVCFSDDSSHDGMDPRYRHEQVKRKRQDDQERWLEFLQQDLGVKVIEDHRLQDVDEDAETASDFGGASEASTELRLVRDRDDVDSITSHEFGVEHEDVSEAETSDDELVPEDVFFEGKQQKFLRKGVRQKLNGMSRSIREMARTALATSSTTSRAPTAMNTSSTTTPPSTPTVPAGRPRRGRRPGPWRVLEIFTWTMAISLAAVAAGWEAGEPITLPGWDLLDKQCQKDAKQYIATFDPDFLVIAWPWAKWSILQTFGHKTVDQLRALYESRQQQRVLLDLVEDVVRDHRSKGGVTMGKNPFTSRAWREPAIVAAFEGLPKARTDMCAFGLQRPRAEFCSHKRPLYLRKPTLLAADAAILKQAARLCPGRHRHVPCLGGVRVKGKWVKLSEWAGGYTKTFARAVVRGAEEALQHRRRHGGHHVTFARQPLLPEEAFVESDAEILDDVAVPEEEDGDGNGGGDIPLSNGHGVPVRDPSGEGSLRLATSNGDGGDDIPVSNGHGVPVRDPWIEDLARAQSMEVDGELGAMTSVEHAEFEPGSRLERLHLVHRRLGRPSTETLVRMLQMAGADEELVSMVRELKCPVCQRRKQPARPLPARPGSRPIAFNYEVHVDLKYIKDAAGELFVALSMVDAATCYHAAKLLRCREPHHVAGKLMTGWIAIYGVPVSLVCDQGGEFESDFIATLEQHGIASKVTGSHAAWQHGFCERQGALLGVA